MLGIFAQTRVFIVWSQLALSTPGINPHFSTGSWEQAQEVARLSHQGGEIIRVVLWFYKTGFAVIAALNNMAGLPWKVHPCTPKHSSSFAL